MIFLLGAGASIPAGLKGIKTLTTGFEELLKGRHQEAYNFIKATLESKYGYVDVEHILQQLNEFVYSTRETLYLFYGEPDDNLAEYQNEFSGLMRKIRVFFRETLETDVNINYLSGLEGFISNSSKLDIFTLNYDSVIETFCEENHIEYTDGFELYWNPNAFKSGGGINLYKLHGSLYWFTTEDGKLIKIPLKKLSTDKEDMFYYSGKKISESMIYPAISKRLEGTPFSHLREIFKTKLLEEDLLIVVGYSFRDEEILSIVQDQFQINSDLWLAIVDLESDKVKKIVCRENTNLSNRTIALKMKTEEAFGKRSLNENVANLNWALQNESDYRAQLSTDSYYHPAEMTLTQAITFYKKINHFDRIKLLVEELFSTYFSDFGGPSYDFEAELFRYSMKFVVDSMINSQWNNAELWLQIFSRVAFHAEWEVIHKSIPRSENVYINMWLNEKKTDIPYGKGIRSNVIQLLEEVFINEVDLSALKQIDPKLSNLIETIFDSLKELRILARKASKPERYNQYISSIQEKKSRIFYDIPELAKQISEKVNVSESIIANWPESILIR